MKVTLTQQELDNGWISNIGNDERCHPNSLSDGAYIEIKRRNGVTAIGYTYDWFESWRETDGASNNIVAYRIVK